MNEAEIFEFLQAIERGDVLLDCPDESPQDTYAGNVDYRASNGWQITIFNDCNEWDYIDSVEAADGRTIDFDALWETMPKVRTYRPSEEVSWRCYGIPGYLKHRDEPWPPMERGA